MALLRANPRSGGYSHARYGRRGHRSERMLKIGRFRRHGGSERLAAGRLAATGARGVLCWGGNPIRYNPADGDELAEQERRRKRLEDLGETKTQGGIGG